MPNIFCVSWCPAPGFLACRGTSNRVPIYTHRVHDAHIIPMGVFLLHEMGRIGNRGRIRRHEHACNPNIHVVHMCMRLPLQFLTTRLRFPLPDECQRVCKYMQIVCNTKIPAVCRCVKLPLCFLTTLAGFPCASWQHTQCDLNRAVKIWTHMLFQKERDYLNIGVELRRTSYCIRCIHVYHVRIREFKCLK